MHRVEIAAGQPKENTSLSAICTTVMPRTCPDNQKQKRPVRGSERRSSVAGNSSIRKWVEHCQAGDGPHGEGTAVMFPGAGLCHPWLNTGVQQHLLLSGQRTFLSEQCGRLQRRDPGD